MDSSGTLYSGEVALRAIETDKGVIEITEQQYSEFSKMTVEARIEEYKKLAEYNANVNTRQVRRAKQRYGR